MTAPYRRDGMRKRRRTQRVVEESGRPDKGEYRQEKGSDRIGKGERQTG